MILLLELLYVIEIGMEEKWKVAKKIAEKSVAFKIGVDKKN